MKKYGNRLCLFSLIVLLESYSISIQILSNKLESNNNDDEDDENEDFCDDDLNQYHRSQRDPRMIIDARKNDDDPLLCQHQVLSFYSNVI